MPVSIRYETSKSIHGAKVPRNIHHATAAPTLLAHAQLQNKLAEARSTLQSAVDPLTGRRLFHPETCARAPAGRNTSALPVGEYLYQQGQAREGRVRAAAAEAEARRIAEAACAKAATGSAQLVRALKERRFRQVRGVVCSLRDRAHAHTRSMHGICVVHAAAKKDVCRQNSQCSCALCCTPPSRIAGWCRYTARKSCPGLPYSFSCFALRNSRLSASSSSPALVVVRLHGPGGPRPPRPACRYKRCTRLAGRSG